MRKFLLTATIVILITAVAIISYVNNKHQDINIEETIPSEAQVINNNVAELDAAKTELIANAQDNLKYLGLENELIEAKLITGIEYYINENQKNQRMPSLINFKYKEKDCSAFGELEPGNQKSMIRLNYAKCDNDDLQINGFFFDVNKDLGSSVTLSPDSQKYIVSPQDGFIVINSITQNIEISSNDIPKLKLLNAEVKTSTFMFNSTSENLPVLISFDNNGVICNSSGDISSVNGLSFISVNNIKCGEQKYPDLKGIFVSPSRMLNPVEVFDENNEKMSVPLQTGFVFFSLIRIKG